MENDRPIEIGQVRKVTFGKDFQGDMYCIIMSPRKDTYAVTMLTGADVNRTFYWSKNHIMRDIVVM